MSQLEQLPSRLAHLLERKVRHSKLRVISKPRTSQIQTRSTSSRSPRRERKVRHSKLRVISKPRTSRIQTNSKSSRSPKLGGEIRSVNEILNQLNIRGLI